MASADVIEQQRPADIDDHRLNGDRKECRRWISPSRTNRATAPTPPAIAITATMIIVASPAGGAHQPQSRPAK
jgi:hypothetical protein